MPKMTSREQAVPSLIQHTHPCGDCPLRRDSIKGWLGGATADEYVQLLHSDTKVDCHTTIGPQCAGVAIYRANVCKSPRDPTALRLPANRDNVFANPNEFKKHHEEK